MKRTLLMALLLATGPAFGQNIDIDIDIEVVSAGVVRDGENGVDGLAGANGLEVSPDGRHVYVASCGGDSVAVFDRNPSTGGLTFKQAVVNGKNGVQGLDCAAHVEVSPDGSSAYVTGYLSDSLVEFDRNPKSGKLTFRFAHFDGVAGVFGLDAPTDLGISTDGRLVSVSSYDNDNVTYWQRTGPENNRLAARKGDAFYTLVGYEVVTEPDDFFYSHSLTLFQNEPFTHTGVLASYGGEVFLNGWTLGWGQDEQLLDSVDIGSRGIRDMVVVQDSATRERFSPSAGPLPYALLVGASDAGPYVVAIHEDGTFGEPSRIFGTGTMDGMVVFPGVLVGADNARQQWVSITDVTESAGGDLFASPQTWPSGRRVGPVFDMVSSAAVEEVLRLIGGADRTRAGDDTEPFGRLSFYATHPFDSAVSAWNVVRTCKTGGEQLCLGGGRYLVTADWRTKKKSGTAKAVRLTQDTGYFWFFDKDNVEVVLKVHDGCGFNDRQWVFAGGLTDVAVDIRVEDLLTGEVQEYSNKLNRAFEPVRNIEAFNGCLDVPDAQMTSSSSNSRTVGSRVETAAWSTPIEIASRELGMTVIPRATCKAGDTTLCINQDRFQVEVDWATKKQSGEGHAVDITPDTGYFWFFGKSNIEMVIKVFNGCGNNGNFWVFAGGLTDVDVDITVTDTMTGREFEAHNPLGSAFRPIRNITSFPCS